MRDGTCPKCGIQSVFGKRNGMKFGEEDAMVFTSGKVTRPTPIDYYVCVHCGYFETYLADPTKLEQIARAWTKIG